MAPVDPYLQHRDLIERAIGLVCRRQGLSGHDADDFASIARLHLIENDFAVLRRFRSQCSFQTYLCVVLTRQFQDWRNARWGKFRASAAARRLGNDAVLLERLTVRDGLSFDEAAEALRTQHGLTEPRTTLESWAAEFPPRSKRWFVGEEHLANVPAIDNRPDAPLRRAEAAQAASDVRRELVRVLAGLEDQDRLILQLLCAEDFSVADIARELQLDQKSLYPRLGRLRARLRHELGQAGIGEAHVNEVLDQRGFDVLSAQEYEASETGAGVRLFDRGVGSPVPKERAE